MVEFQSDWKLVGLLMTVEFQSDWKLVGLLMIVEFQSDRKFVGLFIKLVYPIFVNPVPLPYKHWFVSIVKAVVELV